ncbi:hypothetical protein PoB_001364500 [Plakobranchus ocellatus]|uniref:Uncharacterized protein n=1 Tax=Plakobranchus ocellatus TaxID=259542 RepID=A0AAV3YVA8_9GAST|nr:hypothetical protein PoB_001364500 [Plakobranchus ocellatus]
MAYEASKVPGRRYSYTRRGSLDKQLEISSCSWPASDQREEIAGCLDNNSPSTHSLFPIDDASTQFVTRGTLLL